MKVLQRLQNIRLGITGHPLRNFIVFPKIGFNFLELYHDNPRIGSRSDKVSVCNRASRRHCRQLASMPVCVRTRHNRKRVVALQRRVDVLLRIFGAVFKPVGKLSCLNGLIPYGKNPAVSRHIAENLVLITDACIDKADCDIFSGQIERRSLHGKDTHIRKAERIKVHAAFLLVHLNQAVAFGNKRVGCF